MDQPLTTGNTAGEVVNGGGAEDDPFLLQYQPSDLRIASEFLTTWLPFLSRDLCSDCSLALSIRIRSLSPTGTAPAKSDEGEGTNSGVAARTRVSWADMAAQEDELASPGGDEEEEEEEEEEEKGDVGEVNREASGPVQSREKPKLSRDQREYLRFMNVQRKKDFVSLERVKGKVVNVLSGLELHKGIFSAAEQKRIVDYVYQLQESGRRGELRERTFTAPQKWMKGKGRVTIQFGCCYNYATDKHGNPPGILHSETVDPIPSLLKVIIRRLIRWHVLPPSCVPDSCIVNIYDEGDCIPPHIDNHDFLRPFCTVSFLSECNIVFGTNLKIVGPGEFDGPVAIPLPVGSVLVLNGNSADVAKHCVPSVPTKRISITFRRMDEKKRPASFIPEADLQGIQPLSYESNNTEDTASPMSEDRLRKKVDEEGGKEARPYIERSYHSEYSNRARRMDEKKPPSSFVPEQGIQQRFYESNNTEDKEGGNDHRSYLEQRSYRSEPRYSNRGRRGSANRPRIKVDTNS